MKKNRIAFYFIFIGLILFLSACSSMMTMKDQFKGVNDMIAKRNFAGALAQIEGSKDKYYEAKDRVMYYLDVGMLSHYLGNYEQSNQYLTQAEDAIEELFTASVSKAAASLMLNDNALDYTGEDYEDIYLNVFKALNYMHLDKWDDALVEIKRLNNKLNLLEDKYQKLAEEYNKDKDAKIKIKTGTNNFYNSALARYIGMLLYRGEAELDSARIDRDKIREAFEKQANLYTFAQPDLKQALTRSADPRVNFICFTGKNPDKLAVTLRLHSGGNKLVIVPSAENEAYKEEFKGFMAVSWSGVDADLYFKFQIPVMKEMGSVVESIAIRLTGVKDAQLKGEQIESLERIAKFTFEIKKPMIYTKTIIRSVVKGLVAYAAKKGVKESTKKEQGGALWSLLFDVATDVAVDVSENADLRTSHFFPAQARIAEATVPAGKYAVEIDYLGKNGQVLFTDIKDEIEVKKEGLNLVESFYLE